MTERRKQLGLVLVGLLVVLASAWMLGYAIEPGIGLASDSYYYVSGADTLYDGEGFGRIAGNGEFKPTTHFPPVYSIVLLVTRLVSRETISAAPALHQVLLLGFLALVGILAYRLTSSYELSVVCILLVGIAPAMLSVFSWLLSEGMFLLVILGVFVVMTQYQRQRNPWWLALAGLLTGAAYLTRYAGITLAAAIGLAILLSDDTKRWSKLGQYLRSSALLPVLWLIRNWRIAGVTTNRSLGWHPISLEKVRSGLSVMAGWILPGQIPDILRLGVLFLLAVVIILGFFVMWKRGRKRGTVEISMLAFLLIYPAFLVISISIFDAATPLDERILSPMFPIALILAIHLISTSWVQHKWPGWIKPLAVIGIVVFAGLTMVRGVRQASEMHLDGQGFSSARWRQSALIEWLNAQPHGTTLYSNELDAIYLLTGHLVYQVPIKWDPVREQPREDYENQLEAMRLRLEAEDGYLVLMETLSNQQAFFPSETELSEGMESVLEASLGTVYAYP
jgi:4-amino-4-deoxy-L-arabinose transferase-like glycosyltransferase